MSCTSQINLLSLLETLVQAVEQPDSSTLSVPPATSPSITSAYANAPARLSPGSRSAQDEIKIMAQLVAQRRASRRSCRPEAYRSARGTILHIPSSSPKQPIARTSQGDLAWMPLGPNIRRKDQAQRPKQRPRSIMSPLRQIPSRSRAASSASATHMPWETPATAQHSPLLASARTTMSWLADAETRGKRWTPPVPSAQQRAATVTAALPSAQKGLSRSPAAAPQALAETTGRQYMVNPALQFTGEHTRRAADPPAPPPLHMCSMCHQFHAGTCPLHAASLTEAAAESLYSGRPAGAGPDMFASFQPAVQRTNQTGAASAGLRALRATASFSTSIQAHAELAALPPPLSSTPPSQPTPDVTPPSPSDTSPQQVQKPSHLVMFHDLVAIEPELRHEPPAAPGASPAVLQVVSAQHTVIPPEPTAIAAHAMPGESCARVTSLGTAEQAAPGPTALVLQQQSAPPPKPALVLGEIPAMSIVSNIVEPPPANPLEQPAPVPAPASAKPANQETSPRIRPAKQAAGPKFANVKPKMSAGLAARWEQLVYGNHMAEDEEVQRPRAPTLRRAGALWSAADVLKVKGATIESSQTVGGVPQATGESSPVRRQVQAARHIGSSSISSRAPPVCPAAAPAAHSGATSSTASPPATNLVHTDQANGVAKSPQPASPRSRPSPPPARPPGLVKGPSPAAPLKAKSSALPPTTPPEASKPLPAKPPVPKSPVPLYAKPLAANKNPTPPKPSRPMKPSGPPPLAKPPAVLRSTRGATAGLPVAPKPTPPAKNRPPARLSHTASPVVHRGPGEPRGVPPSTVSLGTQATPPPVTRKAMPPPPNNAKPSPPAMPPPKTAASTKPSLQVSYASGLGSTISRGQLPVAPARPPAPKPPSVPKPNR